MWRIMNLSALIIAASLFLSEQCFACFADIPLDQVIEDSDFVIVGEVTRMGDPVTINKRAFGIAIITVQETLMGKAPKEVSLAFPDRRPGGIRMSTDISFKQGQKGIWILSKDKVKDYYWATYPKDFQRLSKKDEIKSIIKGLGERVFSKPVNGLAAYVSVTNRTKEGTIKGNAVGLSLAVRNTTDKPMQICTYAGDRPARLQADGPDGKTRIDFYEWLKRGRLPACQAKNFAVIQPGQAKRIGNYGALWARNLKPGDYEFTMSFRAKRDGKEHKLENAWTGAVAAPPVKVTINK